jgi:hypothetical protein
VNMMACLQACASGVLVPPVATGCLFDSLLIAHGHELVWRRSCRCAPLTTSHILQLNIPSSCGGVLECRALSCSHVLQISQTLPGNPSTGCLRLME